MAANHNGVMLRLIASRHDDDDDDDDDDDEGSCGNSNKIAPSKGVSFIATTYTEIPLGINCSVKTKNENTTTKTNAIAFIVLVFVVVVVLAYYQSILCIGLMRYSVSVSFE